MPDDIRHDPLLARLADPAPASNGPFAPVPMCSAPSGDADHDDDGDYPDDYDDYYPDEDPAPPEPRTALARLSAPPRHAFTPVAVAVRHDGWTPERQRGFIEALADTGSVSAAAASQGMRVENAYRLRRRPDAESFCRAWAAAQAMGVRRLTDIAIERAIHGVAEPVFYQGEVVGERRRYDNKLLMFTLRHHDPAYLPGIEHVRDFDPVAFHADRAGEMDAHLAASAPPPPAGASGGGSGDVPAPAGGASAGADPAGGRPG